MNKVKIVNAKRSAIGKFLGSLYEQKPTDICVPIIDDLFSKQKKLKKFVNTSIFGNAIPAGLGQGINRKICIQSGIPIDRPSYSVNMVCGSGMQAIINSYNEIKLGQDLVLTGGFEFMSNVPYATDTYIRKGKKFSNFNMVDLLINDGLKDSMYGIHMGITAENIAKELNISRKSQDNYAILANDRAIKAIDNGVFKNEIVPINFRDYKGDAYVFKTDEFPNRFSNYKKLSKLKPVFIKSNGTVTAGNSSGINDGAAFLLLASEDFCKKHKIDSHIEILGYCSIGCDPRKMGLGPYYAIIKLLKKTNINFKEIDLFEINEAFSAQILGCYKLLSKKFKVSKQYIINRTNVNGSGLGLGHPLGCSGARIVVSLYHEMLRRKKCKYGIASLCVGGGMGIALLLKKE